MGVFNWKYCWIQSGILVWLNFLLFHNWHWREAYNNNNIGGEQGKMTSGGNNGHRRELMGSLAYDGGCGIRDERRISSIPWTGNCNFSFTLHCEARWDATVEPKNYAGMEACAPGRKNNNIQYITWEFRFDVMEDKAMRISTMMMLSAGAFSDDVRSYGCRVLTYRRIYVHYLGEDKIKVWADKIGL